MADLDRDLQAIANAFAVGATARIMDAVPEHMRHELSGSVRQIIVDLTNHVHNYLFNALNLMQHSLDEEFANLEVSRNS